MVARYNLKRDLPNASQPNCISANVADSGLSPGNSRAASTLAAGATFQGVGEDVSGFGRAGISVKSSYPAGVTRGTLTIEVSHDNVNWSGPTREISDTSTAQPVMWAIVEKYFRVKYVNGPVAATDLSIQVQYSNNDDILLATPLSDTFIDETQALATRSVLVGKDEGGDYRNVAATLDGKLKIDADEFSNLQSEMLATLKNIDKRLQIISGYEMIDETEDT